MDRPVTAAAKPMVIEDSLPYGGDLDGTIPMHLDQQSLPADVALSLERESKNAQAEFEERLNNAASQKSDDLQPEEPVP